MCWQAISSRQLLLLESIVLARFGRYRIETSTFIFFRLLPDTYVAGSIQLVTCIDYLPIGH